MNRINHLKFFSLISFFVFSLFSGCDHEANEARTPRKVRFKFNVGSASSGGRISSLDADALLVSIEDMSGAEHYVMEEVEIYQIGDGFLSAPVSLPPGEYRLTLFALIDDNDNIIAATPMEDSPAAEFVDDPLPIEFEVTSDETTYVNPQVVILEDHVDIGYAEFGIEVVKVLPMTVSVTDAENDLPITATLTIQGHKSQQVVWTKTVELLAAENQIQVRGGLDTYSFIIEKESFFPETFILTYDDLKQNDGYRFFQLTRKYAQLKSIVSEVYCCPGSGFDGSRSTYTYNTRRQLSAISYSYHNGSQWVSSSNIQNYYIEHFLPYRVKHNIPGNKYLQFDNTISNNRIVQIKITNTASGSLGNYTITLNRDPTSSLITQAVMHDNDYNTDIVYTHTYNTRGDLIAFEARIEDDLLYQGEFTYDDYENVYPAQHLNGWLETMTNAGYDDLLVVPFAAEKPKYNITKYVLMAYSNGNLISKETISMNYTYDVQHRPASLIVQDKVEVPGYNTIVIERQKDTVFEYY